MFKLPAKRRTGSSMKFLVRSLFIYALVSTDVQTLFTALSTCYWLAKPLKDTQ